MKFKIYHTKEPKSGEAISALGWCNNEEVYSCSEDHQLFRWTSTNREFMQVAKLPDDFAPTDLHWLLPKGAAVTSSGGAAGGKGSDTLLICSGDGRFIILNKSARVERNVSAHSGSIVAGRWSPDGAGLLTAGEDGIIKIWSRSGMLRSTVVQHEGQIRCARWAPNATAIAYCQGPFVAIKPLAANSKLTKWRAHDGLVLCIAWSNNTDMLASGGEDCRYKIWDAQGANIYTSVSDDYAITSLDFSPDGELLAVGGFNMLKLCHYSGVSCCWCQLNKLDMLMPMLIPVEPQHQPLQPGRRWILVQHCMVCGWNAGDGRYQHRNDSVWTHYREGTAQSQPEGGYRWAKDDPAA